MSFFSRNTAAAAVISAGMASSAFAQSVPEDYRPVDASPQHNGDICFQVTKFRDKNGMDVPAGTDRVCLTKKGETKPAYYPDIALRPGTAAITPATVWCQVRDDKRMRIVLPCPTQQP